MDTTHKSGEVHDVISTDMAVDEASRDISGGKKNEQAQ